MPIKIEDFEGKDLYFYVSHMVEFFPAPIPERMDDLTIEKETDLFRMSHIFGYDEIFLNEGYWVYAECEGRRYRFPISEFLRWQLERINAETIWQIISKTDALVSDLLDEDSEYEKDPEYNPEAWLDIYARDEFPGRGVAFIQHLRSEIPDRFYSALIESLLDERFGVLNTAWYEFEIDGNLDEAKRAYASWEIPLMMVYTGKFAPYVGADYTQNLLMDDYKLLRMYVRNYDEG